MALGWRAKVADGRRRRELERAVAAVPHWFHSIDLGDGVVTPGHKTAELLAAETESFRLPDLGGKTVLDIGAWDGFFSFEAERRGAGRVVALDHYAWSLDVGAMRAYWDRCREEGRQPELYEHVPEVWHPDTLPGKRGFDLCHSALGSGVEAMVADFMATDPARIGTFDITFFLGVLYHLEDPMAALRRLRQVTGERAVIETACMVLVGLADRPMWDFFPADELNGDPGNWWAPNVAALVGACRAAGFSDVEVVAQPPDDLPPWEVFHGRAVVHAIC
jgi:tRNA (mo5U34)-methyltransferase